MIKNKSSEAVGNRLIVENQPYDSIFFSNEEVNLRYPLTCYTNNRHALKWSRTCTVDQIG